MDIEYLHAAKHGSGAMARKRRSSVRRAGFRVALISATMFASRPRCDPKWRRNPVERSAQHPHMHRR